MLQSDMEGKASKSSFIQLDGTIEAVPGLCQKLLVQPRMMSKGIA